MLGLERETDKIWVEVAEANLKTLMVDHAHCELKAALSALSLVSKYGPQYPSMVAPLSDLAAEEMQHLQQVNGLMQAEQCTPEFPEKDRYVSKLRCALRGHKNKVPELLDRLLVASMIEARSCERFSLLARHLTSTMLQNFYRDLMTSEARHHRLFRKLAEDYFGSEQTKSRWREVACLEAKVMDVDHFLPLMHG